MIYNITKKEIDSYKNGENYRAYDILGSHFNIEDGIKGYRFSVFAPNAKRVFLAGDFNNWDYSNSEMENLFSSGIYAIFISNAKKYDKYKFVIETFDNKIIWKSDPFAFFSEYNGEKASIVYQDKNFKWEDSSFINNRKINQSYDSPISIYEVNLASWRKYGEGYYSYEALSDQLVNYVKDLGYTHVELMPVTEYPFDGSWGYQQTGYYSITSRFGEPSGFKTLINEFHKAGIGVILDWVACHYPKDSHGLIHFDGKSVYESDYWHDAYNPEWDTINFDFGKKHVRNFLISNLDFLIDEYHIDGFRFDAVAYMIHNDMGKMNRQPGYNYNAIDFLKEITNYIKTKNSVLLFAEESSAFYGVTKSVEDYGLGFDYKWNMGWMNDTLKYMKMDPYFRGGINHSLLTFPMVYAFNERFLLPLSHDEVVHMKRSLVEKMPGDDFSRMAQLRSLYLYQYTHPGKKLLFMGGEFAQFQEWNEYGTLTWDISNADQNKKIYKFVKDLNKVYRENEQLYIGEDSWECFEWIEVDNHEQNILIFKRKANNKTVIVAINFSATDIINHKIDNKESKFKLLINTDSVKYGGRNPDNDIIRYYENRIELDIARFSGIILEVFNG